ncbi:hypothetical protein FisN_13Hh060 [Fistulifera solaris]|uniref:CRAL-TRIO domain-containing protein n=1 Tax=Fistulifera solaris TaxID=1519565 RepID=A0A1Z5KNC6_FISSO|nr:hypothetical protein FisN_13Hh060 [Fistulifera solaris]|eukprot:GAX27833.1 hypothetical protein FisN_13Hh060 [Fistulifera solaris]
MRLLGYGQRTTTEDLKSRFPKATESECRRFHKACPRDAADKLSAYLEWREKHQLDCSQHSEDLKTAAKPALDDGWCDAVRKAIHDVDGSQASSDSSSSTGSGVSPCDASFLEDSPTEIAESTQVYLFHENQRSGESDTSSDPGPESPEFGLTIPRQCIHIPRFADGRNIRDLDGHRIVMHYPGRLEVHKMSNDFYADAMALFIESNLDRNNEEKVTLCVDVRPGRGWPNPSVYHLLGLIRQVANALHDLNPQRLHHCILYPIPRAAFYMWKMIQNFLDPSLRELMVLIPGSSLTAPLPARAMYKYMDEEALACLERYRDRLQDK